MNHETVTELLPWYVNGTLPLHERAAVEAELASCPLCAAQLAELQRVHAALHEIDQDAPGPSESLFARTLQRLDTPPQRKGVAFSLRAWWSDLSTSGRITALTPAVVAIVFVLIVAARALVTPQRASITDVYSVPVTRQQKTLDELQTRNSSGVPQAPAVPSSLAGALSRSEAQPPPAPAEEAQNVISKLKATNGPMVPVTSQRPQLIRTGEIGLLVPDVEHALAQLQMLAQTQFGDVISLNDETPSQPGIRHSAQVQISIPADRFDQVMNALAALGAVQSRSISAENATDQIVDGQARLRNLRRTEADMLRILDRAGKIPDVLEVTQQIAQVREQIEQLDAQVQSLQHRVAYSTISIDIEDEKPVATAEPGIGTQLNDAWKAALRQVRTFSVRLASALLVIVAFAPYWLVLVIVALFVANRLRR
jgi:anti-sigma factor RsiW